MGSGSRSGSGFRPGTSRRRVPGALHLRSARPTRKAVAAGSIPRSRDSHPRGVALSYSGAGPRGDRDWLGHVFGDTGKPGASTGESEVKFAISESSQPGPSVLDAAARLVPHQGSPGRWQLSVGTEQSGCVYRKERLCPGTACLPQARHKDLLSRSWRRVVTGLRSAC